ncbi:hypothetical protein SARC_14637 [Sphaeroforma arctica JP610]|uniref:SET domain-containing protein n=1 Tax=Sphaeroforma arctica JP610 TaxID=667725 RepID=A0A0L0F7V4_9EUKA|nr:hypothetical protein SARC_14637 [Sphaeroforma arctica JP610]KNC72800.1 hypothetical protein SARC_14637 [Sphaeroforma arctica JP610]|eukprot:XP_014146702.1 hypothetical protein SARC_14637 [Sphaeroforma arctica JP610]
MSLFGISPSKHLGGRCINAAKTIPKATTLLRASPLLAYSDTITCDYTAKQTTPHTNPQSQKHTDVHENLDNESINSSQTNSKYVFCPHCYRRACQGECLDMSKKSTSIYYSLIGSNDVSQVLRDNGGSDMTGRYNGMALKTLIRLFTASVDPNNDDFTCAFQSLCFTKNFYNRSGQTSRDGLSLKDEHALLAKAMQDMLGCGNDGVEWVNLALVERVFGALRLNSFGFKHEVDDSAEHRISAVYDIASYFNHSCTPNADVGNDGAMIEIITNQEVDVGQEIYVCYDYGNRDMDVGERKRALWMNYGFECGCKTCRDVQIDRSIRDGEV